MTMNGRRKRTYKSRRKGKSPDYRKMIISFLWLAVVLIILFFIGRYFINENFAESKNADKISEFGNLQEVKLASDMTEEIHEYTGYTVYFNSTLHIPNCVSYEITKDETMGKVPRYKNFEKDPNFANSASPMDYTNSGYDRGHMAPAADMKWDRDAMRESFYMSNVCPQNKSLNTGAWHKLENKVREWAERDSAIMVVCGPVLSDIIEKIGNNEVAVPSKFFKIILAPYAQHPRAIAFLYNNEKCKGEMKKYVVTVDSIESLTGYDFFSSLPDVMENKVERTSNINEWNQR